MRKAPGKEGTAATWPALISRRPLSGFTTVGSSSEIAWSASEPCTSSWWYSVCARYFPIE
ncbi:hypothetical protein N5079_09810 [Planotetraspora sp. A-T 1434]|uniref:hypothetical protein n=1 Tax=Planotetraspora sp. A-T 1434 TaxID=2979219 RepID=UPI0021BE207C|nr:hypothetical protein [Planotetraspora sp. A-T 1434]MCT9930511.1 hypothetical protein [Planotetraspora sp. A-T 1434]